MPYLNTESMIGRLQARQITHGTLTVKRTERGEYVADLAGERFVADILNVQGAASALGTNSELELGGDKEKRITVTVANDNRTYLYVEVKD